MRHRRVLKKRYGLRSSSSGSPRHCLRCAWRGPLSKTGLRDTGDGIAVHTCPNCRSTQMVVTA